MVADKRIVLDHIPVRSLKQPLAEGQTPVILDTGATIGQRSGATPAKSLAEGSGGIVHLAEGLKVIYEDADIFVIDKPSGLLTATHGHEYRATALALLTEYAQRDNQKAKALLIHRLDRDASGLLIFARNTKTFERLKALFEKHDLERTYNAVVHGTFKPEEVAKGGHLVHYLVEETNNTGRVRVATAETPDAREAIMDYQVAATGPQHTLLRCTLHTGRKHQIRVQLAAIGHPVCQDGIYGTPLARAAARFDQPGEPPHRLALHATLLALKHPSHGRPMRFESPTPESFRKVLTDKPASPPYAGPAGPTADTRARPTGSRPARLAPPRQPVPHPKSTRHLDPRRSHRGPAKPGDGKRPGPGKKPGNRGGR
jgi:RluA family pseudouridine synthase